MKKPQKYYVYSKTVRKPKPSIEISCVPINQMFPRWI